ncbi:MAG: hypothetical protein ACFFFB_21125, partial [Candidatus Heimdallarchaeota archaeon]
AHYTIKDIPGSSGRLDVISRCILAAILNENGFKNNIQVWVFLENYGTYIFQPKALDFYLFPKSEILLTDYFVDIIKNKKGKSKYSNNPLKNVVFSNKDILTSIIYFLNKNYAIYILNEEGMNFFDYLNEIISKKNMIFIIGSQTGEIIKSKELVKLNLPNISLGTQSYLASSVIRLIRINLELKI